MAYSDLVNGTAGDANQVNANFNTCMRYDKYAQYSYSVAANTAGGTATSGSWQDYPLNTEVIDAGGIGSLSSNKITLAAGTYYIEANAVLYGANANCRLRIYDSTSSTVLINGVCLRHPTADDAFPIQVCGVFTIAGTKDIKLQYRVENTITTNGLGYPLNWDSTNEIYATVNIWKIG